MDGKPLAHVAVAFQPSGETLNPGPGSSGQTNENGEFTLKVIGTGNKGAVVGWHSVQIHPPASSDGKKPEIKIPLRYNFKTELKFEVKPGNNTAYFELKSTP
jgi:hypothetical protein